MPISGVCNVTNLAAVGISWRKQMTTMIGCNHVSDTKKFDRLLENASPPVFWGKIAKFCAKITRNWKIFVEFIFKDQMVYKFAQE